MKQRVQQIQLLGARYQVPPEIRVLAGEVAQHAVEVPQIAQAVAEFPFVEQVGGAKKGKAIIIINPAEPPLIMRDTIHCLTETAPDQQAITQSVLDMVEAVQQYVPGYKLVNGPVFDGNRVSVFMEVEGLGDFLPKYAGNLDIMTAAGLRTAEMFAEEAANQTITLPARG